MTTSLEVNSSKNQPKTFHSFSSNENPIFEVIPPKKEANTPKYGSCKKKEKEEEKLCGSLLLPIFFYLFLSTFKKIT